MSTRLGPFEISPNSSDPTFKWGLEKVCDNNHTLDDNTPVLAIVFKDLDGNVVNEIEASDARGNSTPITIANEEFPAYTAALFTVTVGDVSPEDFDQERWPVNLVAELSYETSQDPPIVETTVKDVLLRPVEAR